MFLTIHGPVGALVGALAPDPVSAFALGALSHYAIDAIPHGDERLGGHLEGVAKLRFIVRIGLVDAAIAVVALIAILQPWRIWPSFTVLAGVAGGLVPDGLQLLHHLFPRVRWFDWHQWFHDYCHLRIIPYDPRLIPTGLAVQLVVLATTIAVHSRWFGG